MYIHFLESTLSLRTWACTRVLFQSKALMSANGFRGEHVVSDPSRWSEQFPSCGGDRQSPINIVTSRVQPNSSLAPFHFHAYNGTFNLTAENKGHSGENAMKTGDK